MAHPNGVTLQLNAHMTRVPMIRAILGIMTGAVVVVVVVGGGMTTTVVVDGIGTMTVVGLGTMTVETGTGTGVINMGVEMAEMAEGSTGEDTEEAMLKMLPGFALFYGLWPLPFHYKSYSYLTDMTIGIVRPL